jgi:hypothetical protein
MIGEPFEPLYASSVHLGSINKTERMSERMRQMIDEICLPTYLECLALADGRTRT